MKLSFETAGALKAVLILARKLLLCVCVAKGVLCSGSEAVFGSNRFHIPAGG